MKKSNETTKKKFRKFQIKTNLARLGTEECRNELSQPLVRNSVTHFRLTDLISRFDLEKCQMHIHGGEFLGKPGQANSDEIPNLYAFMQSRHECNRVCRL